MKEISLRYIRRYCKSFIYQNVKYNIISEYDYNNKFVICRKAKSRKEIDLPAETIVQIDDELAQFIKEELLIYKEEMEKMLPLISSDLKLLESQGV